MSDPADYNPCACYLNYLRMSQDLCSEAECFTPETLPGPSTSPSTDPTDFMMFMMFGIIGLILYMLRPKMLRESGNDAKGTINNSDSNDEPPFPPPAIN